MIEPIKMATLDSSSFTALAPPPASHHRRLLSAISHRGARVSVAVPSSARKLTLSSNTASRRLFICSASNLQQLPTNVKKLYVSNLPWTLSPTHIQTLFSQCGTVTDVEGIRNKNGRICGFAFVTMACAEEAEAGIIAFVCDCSSSLQ